ncbi:hypothetical protein [Streptacidiphilus carbonis]|uniref:hypothetical protein n=1 Tax=Streptacidiphilus carbonis TaxID=105422 RepID=UPI0005A6DD8A|nr:hypothetical protein [Streptacidiphilus carbonis]
MPEPTAVDPPLPDALLTLFANRAAERRQQAAERFGTFTERERVLMKEAAVMGYVQGTRHPKGDDFPKDSWILSTVIEACLSNPDLYRTISGYVEEAEDA